MTQTLSQLEHSEAFIERHIGPGCGTTPGDAEQTVGAGSLNALIGQIVPKDIQLATPPQVGEATTEFAALAELKAIAAQNQRYKSYIGMGYTTVQTPPVILRNMLENPGWYTAYTPYQPEVSQGRLEALLNFQTVTLDLTGLDLASASLLDEATAAAEAMAMAKRVSKLKDANRFFVADDVHPQTLDVVRTRAETFGFDVIVDDADKVLEQDGVFGVLLQQVGTTGEVHDYSALIAELKSRKMVASVAADFMALVLLTAPGKQGADVVFGTAQRFGVPMGYGGPHAAFFACRRRVQALHAGPHHRRLQRCRRQHRAAHGDADPRAAYPPREGQLQHLYLAGAAGQHRQPVRRVPRPAGPEAHRPAHPPPDRHSGRRPAEGRPDAASQHLVRHPDR